MKMVPCSFDQDERYVVQLAGSSGKGLNIEQAWSSAPFEQFRARMLGACPECAKRELCLGGCPLMPEIVLCNEPQRC